MLFMANNTLHIVVIYIIKYISDYHQSNWCETEKKDGEEKLTIILLIVNCLW